MMNDSRVRRARELFDQLLELPREDRETFLQDAGNLDQSLEEEIRSLLEAHQEAEGFLESEQIARALADLSSGGDDPLVGTVIGDYWILGLLGRGGMGAVYRAEQVHPHREVSLKLIDRGFASPELLRRFEVEAEVLARLQHPGIAQIHVEEEPRITPRKAGWAMSVESCAPPSRPVSIPGPAGWRSWPTPACGRKCVKNSSGRSTNGRPAAASTNTFCLLLSIPEPESLIDPGQPRPPVSFSETLRAGSDGAQR